MPQLLVLRGLPTGQVYPVKKALHIGNLPTCEVYIPGINTSLHIVIEANAERFQLAKGQGKEPLFVNGQEVQQAILRHGDIIGVSKCMFLFQEMTAPNLAATSLPPSQESEENQLAAFYHISSLVSNVLDLKELLHHLASSLLENFQATTVLVFLKENDQDYLKMVIHKSRLEKVDWSYLKSVLSAKVLSLVSRQKKGVLCRCEYEGNVSHLMLSPLIYQNEILGMVVLEAQQKSQIFVDEETPKQIFNIYDLYALGGITLLAATGIANLKRYQERKKHTQRLETLNKITLRLSSLLHAPTIYKETAREVCKLLHCTMGMVLYLDQEAVLRVGYAVGIPKEEARQFSLAYGKNQLGRIIEKGRPQICETIPECFPESFRKLGGDACVVAPVFDRSSRKSKPLGAICVTGRLHNNAFSKQDKELLSFIASHLGTSLANASLYEQATVDFLTKVYLRGHFFEKLQEETVLLPKDGGQMSLLMLDIDFFKKLNDAYGHAAGDAVLQELGAILKKCIREQDIAGRYGGEEFIVLLKNTGNKNAVMIAERIRNQIAQTTFRCGNLSLQITVSVGVTQYQASETVDQLVARCDHALYVAKNSGRNKVCYG